MPAKRTADDGRKMQNLLKQGVEMAAELNVLDVWIPEQMSPGTIFMLEHQARSQEDPNPYWAVLACPTCGSLGLITRRQCVGLEVMICGAPDCSAEYFLEQDTVRFRRPN